MKKPHLIRQITDVLKKSYSLLASSNPILLSASTAFFATFALAPILIILSYLLNIFFERDIILPKLFSKIALAVGPKTTEDIKSIVDNFLSLETSLLLRILLTIFFYFVATTLLSAVRQSIHQLWEIRKKPTRKAGFHLKERLIEIGMIMLIGVLFLAALLSDEGLALVKDSVPFADHLAYRLLNMLFSVVIISAWFMFFFKLMPEARLTWRVAFAGGLLTGVLFALGRLLLTNLLVHAKVARVFGPSASIALLLLFIFYCSFILYFGAAFTIEYSKAIDEPVKPGALGERYRETRVVTGNR